MEILAAGIVGGFIGGMFGSGEEVTIPYFVNDKKYNEKSITLGKKYIYDSNRPDELYNLLRNIYDSTKGGNTNFARNGITEINIDNKNSTAKFVTFMFGGKKYQINYTSPAGVGNTYVLSKAKK